ncbi:MAG TPA: rod-binding protein [Methylocella sp.]|nr:rod-binding protein [Methylocella sp.]
MSINPVSDIVLDVARAADPGKLRRAEEKLAGENESIYLASSAFQFWVSHSTGSREAPRLSITWPNESIASTPFSPGVLAKAYKGLERLILKNVIESILPKEAPALFGSGTAGDIWRFLLADRLADEMGRTVSLGIAPGEQAAPQAKQGEFLKDFI